MSPARRYRHCPEHVALMTSSKNSTSSLGGESREKGGALGIQKTTIRESKLKNCLLLALHRVKLHLDGQYTGWSDYSDMCRCYLFIWEQLLKIPKIPLFLRGFITILFDTELKRIPYSNRYHLLTAPSLGAQTIRVKSILEEIVQAMHSGLRLPDRQKTAYKIRYRALGWNEMGSDGGGYKRWHEMEADYIGLMLMASAGYDPQLTPPLYESLHDQYPPFGGLFGSLFLSHPSWRKRAKKLKEPKVMEQAVAIYKEAKSGLGVRSFI
ncbi:hypothetical protein RHGRI_014970 [Rhododendron griersonianum]|uniref:Peptidase M48 domain-containing protein n=1 Tax=Rhododendron griersonianum TaxID=479676 RepID=A0AAV6KBZ6_9ERIC|nr:hypothetical protein RHGRI_014970 [Rhododendron griersonianum]